MTVGDLGWSRRSENYSGTDDITVFLPRDDPAGRVPVIWCHGLFGSSTSTQYRQHDEFADDIGALTGLGYPVFVADLGGVSTWAVDSSLALVGAVRTHAGSAFGCRTDKAAFVAESMGGLTGLDYVAGIPAAQVVAVALRVPVVAFEAFRNRNDAAFGGAIDTAWGSYAAWQAGLPTHDPSAPALVSALSPLADRGHVWHCTSDEYIPPAEIAQWCRATGWGRTEIPGTHESAFETSVGDVTRFLVTRLDAA